MNKTIKITNGAFSYKTNEVFKNLNLEIPLNSITCILGESGCGKTTLLKIISQRLKLKKGIIENAIAAGDYSFAYQDIRLIPHLTAIQNIEYILPDYFLKKEKKERALYYLNALGLFDFIHFLPSELSGGMQRRAGLARALAYPAPFILLDEAFDSLDDKNKHKIAELFLSIVKEENKTAICVTHDTVLAKKLACNVIRLKE
ncbi:ATP-binding cassette domain-containing protein [Treponema pedis]|uniref:ATP-binding cassette domain-containing protein n=2 Tax=Treponema pedis TaxID=409322 RepID=UPI001981B440|nr:ATP-binding cassette domain-containing protein [Treponema pedis]QSI04231.1 ABC transporter ATP-binding protein [Treponema pedis]